MNMFDLIDDLDMFRRILEESYKPTKTNIYSFPKNTVEAKPATNAQPKLFWAACPMVDRAIFNGDTTIVFFTDGTRCEVNCSKDDKYDRKTAVAYAIVKRLLGKVGKYDKNRKKFIENDIDGAGFGMYLQKIVDNGFDQQAEEQAVIERKKNAKAAHLAKQKAEQEAAFNRRVEERAQQILLERAAMDRANDIEDKSLANSLDNSRATSTKTSKSISSYKDYKRPDKPFSKFTQQEKREYWKYYNAKRRSS